MSDIEEAPNLHQWVQTRLQVCGSKISAAMLTSIQSAGVVPEQNLRNSLHAGDKAHKQGIHPGFETQGRHYQKSKTGVFVAPQKGLIFSKKFLKKEGWPCMKV